MEESHHIFKGAEDPGKSNAARHDPHGMPMIGLLPPMRGGGGCSGMALSGHTKRAFPDGFMTPGHGTASHDAFRGPFNAVDPLKPQTVARRLAEGFAGQPGDVIAPGRRRPRIRRGPSRRARGRFWAGSRRMRGRTGSRPRPPRRTGRRLKDGL